MSSLEAYFFHQQYKKILKLGDRLAEVDPLIDWEAFKPVIQPIYDNQGPMGGRPNTDPVIMVKMLVLQAWYGLNDLLTQQHICYTGNIPMPLR
jgi:IS5 family transposase